MSTVPIWGRPEPGSRKPRYTREQIAALAMKIADTEGLDAVSMRRVAMELGSGTMTLYHYVKNKSELFALMEDAMMGELLVLPEELPDDWRGGLAAIARKSHEAHQRHGWVSQFHDDDQAPGGPNGMRHFEQSLAVAARTGLPLDRQLEVIIQVDEYVLGYAMRDRMMPAPAEKLEDVAHFSPDAMEYMLHQLSTGDYPNVEGMMEREGGDVMALIKRMIGLMVDPQRFERGLDRLLDGIEVEVERHRNA